MVRRAFLVFDVNDEKIYGADEEVKICLRQQMFTLRGNLKRRSPRLVQRKLHVELYREVDALKLRHTEDDLDAAVKAL